MGLVSGWYKSSEKALLKKIKGLLLIRKAILLTMYISILASLLCAVTQFSHALDPTRLVYQFPKGTWVENIFVRPSGSLLLTILTTPDLYLLDPFASNPQAQLLHRFTSSQWLTGITETDPETYYVIGANATYENLSPTPGSNRLYRVHFRGNSTIPETSLAVEVKDAVFLNGLIKLNPTTVLASDSTLGAVWAIDITTGSSRIVIRDPLMAPTPAQPKLGINGIRLHGTQTLYFANSAQALLGRIRIHANGTAAGPAEEVAPGPPGTFYDDFALDRHGDAFLSTQPGDSIAEVSVNGSTRIIAGVVNTTEIAEPTGAQFGRTTADGHVLYVVTAGGLAFPIDGDVVVGGQVVAVDTK